MSFEIRHNLDKGLVEQTVIDWQVPLAYTEEQEMTELLERALTSGVECEECGNKEDEISSLEEENSRLENDLDTTDNLAHDRKYIIDDILRYLENDADGKSVTQIIIEVKAIAAKGESNE